MRCSCGFTPLVWLLLIGPNQTKGTFLKQLLSLSLCLSYICRLSQCTKLFLWETFKHFLLSNPPSLILTDLTWHDWCKLRREILLSAQPTVMNARNDVCNESGDGWRNLGAGRTGRKKTRSSVRMSKYIKKAGKWAKLKTNRRQGKQGDEERKGWGSRRSEKMDGEVSMWKAQTGIRHWWVDGRIEERKRKTITFCFLFSCLSVQALTDSGGWPVWGEITTSQIQKAGLCWLRALTIVWIFVVC